MANKAKKGGKEKQEQAETKLHIEIVDRMLNLATAGFGLVAALAWNNLIQEIVKEYIEPWIPDLGKTFTNLIYALIVTVLAVIITLQLSKILRRLKEESPEKE